MKVDVMVLVTARIQFSARIKNVRRSSFSKTHVKNIVSPGSSVGNPNSDVC
jgi:hypothetical protein